MTCLILSYAKDTASHGRPIFPGSPPVPQVVTLAPTHTPRPRQSGTPRGTDGAPGGELAGGTCSRVAGLNAQPGARFGHLASGRAWNDLQCSRPSTAHRTLNRAPEPLPSFAAPPGGA